MPKVMEVPVTEYQAVIEGYIAKYGIKWVYNRKIVSNSNDEEASSSATSGPAIKHRKRFITYSWYMDYNCHRYGKKEENNYTNLSGKQRELQKASKKINCPARLKVTCFKNNLSMVTLEVVNEHNHEVSGSDDIKHLPLSKEARVYIEDYLREG